MMRLIAVVKGASAGHLSQYLVNVPISSLLCRRVCDRIVPVCNTASYIPDLVEVQNSVASAPDCQPADAIATHHRQRWYSAFTTLCISSNRWTMLSLDSAPLNKAIAVSICDSRNVIRFCHYVVKSASE